MLLALDELEQAPAELLAELLPAARTSMPTFGSKHLAEVLTALASLGVRPGRDFLLAAETRLLHLLQPEQVATVRRVSEILSAFSALHHPVSPELVGEAVSYTQRHLQVRS